MSVGLRGIKIRSVVLKMLILGRSIYIYTYVDYICIIYLYIYNHTYIYIRITDIIYNQYNIYIYILNMKYIILHIIYCILYILYYILYIIYYILYIIYYILYIIYYILYMLYYILYIYACTLISISLHEHEKQKHDIGKCCCICQTWECNQLNGGIRNTTGDHTWIGRFVTSLE